MWVLIVIVAVIIILLAIIGLYFVFFALRRKKTVNLMFIPKAETEVDEAKARRKAIIKDNAERFKANSDEIISGLKTKNVSIQSHDGLTLRGELHITGTNRYVILVHGYTGSRKEMRDLAAVYASWGFNALRPDNRAHGESDGKWIGMGWLDKDDIALWVDYILSRCPDAEIVLHGISMGAATVMMTSGLELPPAVKVIVEDCGYTSVWDIFKDEMKAIFHLPSFPILNIFSLFSRLLAGYSPKEASSLKMLAKSKVPMLFIHGEDDKFVRTHMVHECFAAKTTGEKEKLIVKDAGHAESYVREPELYLNTVKSFINRFIPLEN